MSTEHAWKWIESNKEQVIEASDKIWEYAELGLVEFKSSALIADILEENGFAVERGVADMPTAFVATFGKGGPVLGIMGEYDALPSLSQKAVPHKEPIVEGAPGHGCGHNIHGVSGMTGAIAIKEALEKNNIPGTIKFFGCPAEENYSGKVFMVRDGYFDGLDAVLSHHPMMFNSAAMGSTLAVNSVKFHFHGVSAHAAGSPYQGKSALDAIELMNTGVNFMREHIIPEARVHYVIEKGGQQPNVVPPYARSWYYVRAPEREQVEHIYNWVLKIADAADMMARTTHEVEFLEGSYNTLPNKALSDLITIKMREVGFPKYTDEEMKFAKEMAKSISQEEKIESLRQSKRPNWEELKDVLIDQTISEPWDEGIVWPGSTDVADVSWVVPTMEFYTTSMLLGDPGHSWQFVSMCGMSIGHKSLIFAAKTIASAGLDLLTKPELLKQVQDDFEKRRAGRKYKCPIPKHVKPPLKVAEESAKSAPSQT